MSLLADYLDRHRALLPASAAAIDELVATLRAGEPPAAPTAKATAAEIDALHDRVFALVDERGLLATARELRLVSAWQKARLREENRRYTMLLESVEDGMALTQAAPETRFLYLNGRSFEIIERITGYTREQILEAGLDGVPFPPQLRMQIDAQRPQLLAGQSVTAETHVLLPEGVRWRENRLTPVRAPDGNVAAVALITRDITARKIAEARLKLLSKMSALAETLEREGVLQAVARLSIPELSDLCILDVVEDGHVRRAYVAHRDPEKAKIAERLLDISPAPLYASPGGQELLAGRAKLVPEVRPELMQHWPAPLREIYAALELRSLMVVPFVVMGKTVAVALFVNTSDSERRFSNEDLEIAGELARRAAHIIENARLHEELRQRDASLRTALAHSNIGVFQQDRELAVKWSYNDLPADAALDEDKRRALDGERTRRELPVVAGGERRDLVVIHEPVRSAAGEIVGIVGTTVDVTDQKRAQAELEQSLVFRDQMMGILGHDLRNPLAAVLGIVGLARLDANLSAAAKSHLGQIDIAARRMLELIGTLLDFTRTRFAGGLPLQPAATDLRELAARVVDELAAAHLDATIELSARGDARGEWDAGRMAQVVSNLTANAISHGDAQAPVRLGIDGDGEEVRLTVHNRGPAIAAELLPVVFEPFRRGDEARPRGLGLGLYIAREIVRAHGGTIDVRSTALEGTTFAVRLPRRR